MPKSREQRDAELAELREVIIRAESAPPGGVFYLGQGEIATKERNVNCRTCEKFLGIVFVKYHVGNVTPVGRRFLAAVPTLQVVDKTTVKCPECKENVSLKRE